MKDIMRKKKSLETIFTSQQAAASAGILERKRMEVLCLKRVIRVLCEKDSEWQHESSAHDVNESVFVVLCTVVFFVLVHVHVRQLCVTGDAPVQMLLYVRKAPADQPEPHCLSDIHGSA